MPVASDSEQRDREDPRVDRRAQVDGLGQERDERVRHERREQGADEGAGGRQDRTLGQPLPHHARARGADREPQRRVPPLGERARQAQVRDVQAREQQHQAGRCQQHVERLLETLPQVGAASSSRQHLQRRGQEAVALLGAHHRPARVLHVGVEHGLEPRLQPGGGGLVREPRLQASEHVQEAAAPIVEPVEVRQRLLRHRERQEHRRHLAEVETAIAGGGHADDGHRVVVHLERQPDDVGTAAQAVLPVVVREHDRGMRAHALVIGLVQQSSERRPHAQHPEVRPGHDVGIRGLGRPVERQVDLGRVSGENALKDLILGLQLLVHRVRQEVAAAPAAAHETALPAQEHQPVGLAHGQAPVQGLVHEREDRRIRPDAEGHRQHRHRCERAVPGQAAQRVFQVVAKRIEHGSTLQAQLFHVGMPVAG